MESKKNKTRMQIIKKALPCNRHQGAEKSHKLNTQNSWTFSIPVKHLPPGLLGFLRRRPQIKNKTEF